MSIKDYKFAMDFLTLAANYYYLHENREQLENGRSDRLRMT